MCCKHQASNTSPHNVMHFNYLSDFMVHHSESCQLSYLTEGWVMLLLCAGFVPSYRPGVIKTPSPRRAQIDRMECWTSKCLTVTSFLHIKLWFKTQRELANSKFPFPEKSEASSNRPVNTQINSSFISFFFSRQKYENKELPIEVGIMNALFYYY